MQRARLPHAVSILLSLLALSFACGDPEYQVLRGGSWYSSASYCRSGSRNWLGPQYRFSGVGFRVVAVAQ